jgi:hypothetical protein
MGLSSLPILVSVARRIKRTGPNCTLPARRPTGCPMSFKPPQPRRLAGYIGVSYDLSSVRLSRQAPPPQVLMCVLGPSGCGLEDRAPLGGATNWHRLLEGQLNREPSTTGVGHDWLRVNVGPDVGSNCPQGPDHILHRTRQSLCGESKGRRDCRSPV